MKRRLALGKLCRAAGRRGRLAGTRSGDTEKVAVVQENGIAALDGVGFHSSRCSRTQERLGKSEAGKVMSVTKVLIVRPRKEDSPGVTACFASSTHSGANGMLGWIPRRRRLNAFVRMQKMERIGRGANKMSPPARPAERRPNADTLNPAERS